jgi:hypothetical protein
MGWNEGYEIMEKQVIALYDFDLLNKEVLNALMQPFCNRDIDHGGCYDLRTKDGKSADDVICFIIEPERYQKAIDEFIPNPKEPDYNEALHDLYYEITRREWNFW